MSERETAQQMVPIGIRMEAQRCAAQNGRIDPAYLVDLYRRGAEARTVVDGNGEILTQAAVDRLLERAGADPVPVCQWREIATAPKDRWVWFGRPASDCKRKFTISPYRWDESHGMWFSGTGWWGSAESIFTHWCEMREQPPAPPVGPAEGDR